MLQRRRIFYLRHTERAHEYDSYINEKNWIAEAIVIDITIEMRHAKAIIFLVRTMD